MNWIFSEDEPLREGWANVYRYNESIGFLYRSRDLAENGAHGMAAYRIHVIPKEVMPHSEPA